jgi:L-cysteine:1D-myo-inositol 2-amino-2-deoxy-alpha-D-glucopyranoside ligase
MKLFDTAQRKYVAFKCDHLVSMYVCGITPYDSAHLGHVFTFMTYDLLQRRLEDQGHEVRLVRNITDVDEPIYVKAKELGIPYTQLAEQEVQSFNKTMDALHFRSLYAEPRASQYISEMIAMIQNLMDEGFAYYVDKDVYYDTAKDVSFGSFSGLSPQLQKNFMANRGGDPQRKAKRKPLDFLLWKHIAETADPAQWESPFGQGRPGWHIECSVMSKQLLGLPFDLHGGGTDLIFPHHECEIAQNFGVSDTSVCKYWMHVSPMLLFGEKMSKSLGNLVFAKDLLERYDASVIRLSLMHFHHRVGGEWQPELLENSKSLLRSFYIKLEHASKKQTELLLAAVRTSLDDNLDTPQIVRLIHAFVASTNRSKDTDDTNLAALKDHTLDLLGLEH